MAEEVENKICSELVKKLKRGQADLERSLRRLENDGTMAHRKKQQSRRLLSEKPIYSLKDLPRKRARIELLSPSTDYKVGLLSLSIIINSICVCRAIVEQNIPEGSLQRQRRMGNLSYLSQSLKLTHRSKRLFLTNPPQPLTCHPPS